MSENNLEWFKKKSYIILLLIIFFPLGLYLMWNNKIWTQNIRVLITFLIISIIIYGQFNNSSLTNSNDHSEPICEDMRSYEGGIKAGRTDKRGADALHNEYSSCREAFPLYDDNYDYKCFCKGFNVGHL